MTLNTQFEATLRERITEEREKIKNALALGTGVKDFGDYMKLVGKCTAYQEVCDTLCGEVSDHLNKR